jgi:ABC-type multidrug transport system ATPase subunit
VSPTHPKKPEKAAAPRHPPKPASPAKAAAPATAGGPAPKPPRKVSGPPPALGAEGVTKTYGELVALAPLDLRVEHGEGVVLIGHNGSGKTTFLRMAAGLLEPSEGSVTFDGHDAGSLEARARVSYLSDNPTFYEDLSVWEHLEYVARLHGRDDWEQEAADLLGHLGLYERADDLPVTFSRGMRQKASIALGFIRPFEVLLVDEPFVGLDAAGKAGLLDLLDEAHHRGAALLVATHELEFVRRVDRCLALRDGELTYDGTTEGIDVLALVS